MQTSSIIGIILGALLFALYVVVIKSPFQFSQNEEDNEVICKALKEKKKKKPLNSNVWEDREGSKFEKSVNFHYENLNCDKYFTKNALEEKEDLIFANEHSNENMVATSEERKMTEIEAGPSNLCEKLKETYGVIPGVSWGTLPPEQQIEWNVNNCDKLKDVPEISNEEEKNSILSKIKSDSNGKAKKKYAGIHFQSKEVTDWCFETKKKYNVVPMKSWGTLPLNMQDTWNQRHCDKVFISARLMKTPLSTCKGKTISTDKKLPLISILAASTTRKVNNPSTDNLALFTIMLPSLIRTIDCGFKYVYVLGYDKGDPFFDSDEGIFKVKKWFKENIIIPMKENGIEINLKLVKVNNTQKKPGPVFLEMAREAYKDGSDYFYRINDDTEMKYNWPSLFVSTLDHLEKPFGVVGPRCDQGNQQILTHDFTARVHMEIFEMNYYPPELIDWWMDDWISFVYGQKRTFKTQQSQVLHHTGAHGQRYEVDHDNKKHLAQLVIDGKQKIRKWMLKNSVSENLLKEFDNHNFELNFSHKDSPFHYDAISGISSLKNSNQNKIKKIEEKNKIIGSKKDDENNNEENEFLSVESLVDLVNQQKKRKKSKRKNGTFRE